MRARHVVLLVLVAGFGCSVDRSGLRPGDRPLDGGLDAHGLDVDGNTPPVDMFAPGDDMLVPPVDMFVPPVDMFVPPVDMFVPPVDLGPVCIVGATRCAGTSTLETCSGGAWMPLTCALDCSAVGTAHCLAMVPSNVDATLFVDGGNVSIASNATWNTSPCTSAALPGMPMRVTQMGGGDVCVVRVHDLTVSAQLTVQGPIPLVILAQGTITIAATGTIDASAYGTVEGPGGGAGSTFTEFAFGPSPGDDGRHTGTYTDSGGGGGGACGVGGNGGTGGTLTGGNGGPAVATDLSPLTGGSGGGTGGSGESTGLGGAGGGAVQLSALVRVQVLGSLLAGGGGGSGGLDGTAGDGNIGAGGGGGSGGGILVESPIVELNGTVRASGGGGGGAASCAGAGNAGAGVDGATVAGAPTGGARGGTCGGGFFGGIGGSGGADAALDGTSGASNTMTGANGAGGGGGAGCIVIRNRTATLPAGGTRSPSVAPGLQALPLQTI